MGLLDKFKKQNPKQEGSAIKAYVSCECNVCQKRIDADDPKYECTITKWYDNPDKFAATEFVACRKCMDEHVMRELAKIAKGNNLLRRKEHHNRF